MKTANYDIICKQGATFVLSFSWADKETGDPIDYTGRQFRMQVRETALSPDYVLNLTTENDGIVLDGPAGKITVQINAEQTAKLPASTCVYNIEMVTPGEVDVVDRMVQGTFTVSIEVAR